MSLHYLAKREPWKLCIFSHARYSPRPPTSSDRNEILHGGWSSGVSSEIQISSKLVKLFQSCGDLNLPFASDLAKSVGKQPNQWKRSNFDPRSSENAFPWNWPSSMKNVHFHEIPWDPTCSVNFKAFSYICEDFWTYQYVSVQTTNFVVHYTIRYDIWLIILTCAKKLTSSQLNLPYGTEQKRIMKKLKPKYGENQKMHRKLVTGKYYLVPITQQVGWLLWWVMIINLLYYMCRTRKHFSLLMTDRASEISVNFSNCLDEFPM